MEKVKAGFPGGGSLLAGVSPQALFKSGAWFVKKQGSKGRQPLGGVWGVPTISFSSGWGRG